MKKLCRKCGITKSLSDFSRNKNAKPQWKLSSVNGWCKVCRVTASKDYKAAKGRFATPLTGRIQNHVSYLTSAGSTLRSKDLRELYERQGGLCFYTGLKMELSPKEKHDPYLTSIDRIDSQKGYTADNVVFCCLGVNRLKGISSVDELYKMLALFSKGAKYVRNRDARTGSKSFQSTQEVRHPQGKRRRSLLPLPRMEVQHA